MRIFGMEPSPGVVYPLLGCKPDLGPSCLLVLKYHLQKPIQIKSQRQNGGGDDVSSNDVFEVPNVDDMIRGHY